MSSIRDLATWEPLLRLVRASDAEQLAAPGGYLTGQIGLGSWSVPVRRPLLAPGRAAQVEDMEDEFAAVQRVQDALGADGANGVSFMVETAPDGRTLLHVIESGPAVEPGFMSPFIGSLLLVEGAVPEPWRRLPEEVPGAAPAPSADPALLERTLRERLPDAIGATEEEIAAAEARLGVTLPDELKALYRVTRARWQDWGGDYEAAERVHDAVGCEVFSLDGLYLADAASRPCPWQFAAKDAVVTAPDAAVQGLVGSPGWIVFGDNGGGDRVAVDLTPGPGGHTGQVIMIDHERNIGASLRADSLTDMVVNHRDDWYTGREKDSPAVAHVNMRALRSVEAAAHPALEVLSIGVWEGAPLGLAPVVGLPRLRTLSAYPGTLADPLEIAGLKGLEYLSLGPEEWRVLLDAGAVPGSLSAAGIEVQGERYPLPVLDLANELLALRDRPPITRTVLDAAPDTGR
ncbi:SMI1/KNR4 family protein [Streptomyces capillispiralis]|uniref:SMI1/KNR4 family protein SUKH-1 n=1 Tax=Streptomyces capillispiralis TaxID=68182 RepID=A0A561TEK6_9ACTN|nr:SMI1/KNR4 family protein [Streptomyces capillispiralis]TWF85532.1 SMI1/KNR4 family protein SUKH-1 [Streptomyces capillispiralis]GHH90055.1 SMI1/KNR4 family protein [Streptomyces capillispiralis]